MFPVTFVVFVGRESIGGFVLQDPPSRPSTHRAFLLHPKLFLHRGEIERVDRQSRRLATIRRQ